MLNHLRPAFSLVVLFTILTGLAYPLAITGIAQATVPDLANGSPVKIDGNLVGSALIGQSFVSDKYFWSRPSATSPNPYEADGSSGSNLGPTSQKLRDAVSGNITRLTASGIKAPVPADAATASGSGLDPDISPAFARAQVARIAKVRQLPEDQVAKLVDSIQDNRLLGLIGEPHVNVLKLNLALDALSKAKQG
jgi:potassium-transporting ATPase KdpC subunit